MQLLATIFEGETAEIPIKYGAVSYKWRVTNESPSSLACYKDGRQIILKLIPLKKWWKLWL